ncbi:uncharacterized protein BHQ10_009033 [Talaromyces amestolkiae]|uniref:Xylanolytic transcriptional activator regulatory domain-containing protein n=1 Tax=Talaromyces amestolkiae TaxID=1196081 RepID=A0A364LBC8_TALAM|nr:uncharacterized protein BHQ10_009033 [Talaromyces amestolkiae]RAO73021.1 hypothetical protein BHQ10_009033 [Talaromyces amestolkiae]
MTSVFSLPKGPPPPYVQATHQREHTKVTNQPNHRVEKEIRTSPDRRLSPPFDDNVCSWRGGLKGIFVKDRYFGQSNWMNFRSPFSVVKRVVVKHEFDPSTEVYKLTQKCKAASREIKAQEKIALHMHLASHPSDHVPPREMADKLVQSYMQTFGSIYRILHIPKFEEDYESYWSTPHTGSQAHVVAKLLLVMAIGTVFQPQQEAFVLRSSALQWIYVAQTWVTTPFEKCRLNIEVIQLQCLLVFARLVHDVDGDLLRLSAASLLQTAMQIGLHIDAEENAFPNICPQEIQLRRNLWATVLEIVVQMSVDSGGIPLIRTTDYDCKPPLNIDDVVFKHDMNGLISSQPVDVYTDSSLQAMLTQSLPIRLQIAAFVNDFRYDSSTYEQTMALSGELSNFCASNTAIFQSLKGSSRLPTEFQTYMIELLTHQYLFALHFPYATKAKTNHKYYYSRKICLDVARLFLPRSSQMTDHSYTNLRLWGGGIFRAAPLQAATFIADEMIYQIESDTSSLFTREKNLLDGRKDLRRYVEEYVESTIDRMKLGHTNFRPYVMLSALLTQIDALLAEEPVEDKILETIKDRLIIANEVLRACLPHSPREYAPSDTEAQSYAVNSAVSLQDAIRNNSLNPDYPANSEWWFLSGDVDTFA